MFYDVSKVSLWACRLYCLYAACMVYALGGSPTPAALGLVEIMIAILLLCAMGVRQPRAIILGRWSAQTIFFLFGLFAPVVVGIVSGHAPQAILRDLIPFCFLFLPLFLSPLCTDTDDRARALFVLRGLMVCVVMLGVIFALRSLLMRDPFYCWLWCDQELLYLENMPTVLFAALFLLGCGARLLARRLCLRHVILCALCHGMALLPITAMMVTQQRASIGAVVFYYAVILLYFLFQRPLRVMPVLIFLLFLFLGTGFSFAPLFEMLMHKTNAVGLNMRPQEFSAVWTVVSRDLQTFLFGIGWGGHFSSPAVGGVSVNFTHNFFTSFLLKGGLIALSLCVLYIAGFLGLLFRLVCRDPVLGLAVMLPVLIDISLYASFKSLDFGLVLLVGMVSLLYFSNFEHESRMKADASTDNIVHQPRLSTHTGGNRACSV